VAHLSQLGIVLLVASAAACGGKSFEANEQDPNGGSGSAGTGQGGAGSVGGTAHGGSVGKGGSAAAGTSQGGSAGSLCESFDDQPGYYISVAIINKTTAPLYLGQDTVTCGVTPLFRVTYPSFGILEPPGDCRTSCQLLGANGPVGCDAACRLPSSVALQPGEVLYTMWNGLYDVQTELPRQCLAVDYGSTQCTQALQIQPGEFTFAATAGSSLDCTQTTGGACSACMPTGTGGCSVPGSLISGQLHTATTTVLLNSNYGVWGTSAPAPIPPSSGDVPAGAMATLTVELIFTD
jgi:hypothetical protein